MSRSRVEDAAPSRSARRRALEPLGFLFSLSTPRAGLGWARAHAGPAEVYDDRSRGPARASTLPREGHIGSHRALRRELDGTFAFAFENRGRATRGGRCLLPSVLPLIVYGRVNRPSLRPDRSVPVSAYATLDTAAQKSVSDRQRVRCGPTASISSLHACATMERGWPGRGGRAHPRQPS